jgi:hypothetical protein
VLALLAGSADIAMLNWFANAKPLRLLEISLARNLREMLRACAL